MILEIVVPVFYFLLLLLIIGSNRFFKSHSISKEFLLTAFSVKVFCALLYGYFFKNGILSGDDSYLFFDNGNVVYSALDSDVFTYLKLTFGRNDFTPVPVNLFSYIDNMHFWFDNSNYFLVRLNAIIRLFSFGVYNVHAILFAFLSFAGVYYLYLFFENKTSKKKIIQFILFGIPSVVFWTSGIHKEAISVFGLGVILYNLELIMNGRNKLKNFLFLVTGIFILLFIRFYLLVILIPLVFALILTNLPIVRISSLLVYIITIGLFGIFSCIIDILNPQLNIIQEFFIRRNYFLNSYPGAMTFDVISRIPDNLTGYLSLFWEAFSNPVFRPFPSECTSMLTSFACIETYGILFLLFFLIFKSDRKAMMLNSYAIFSILFGFGTLFLIGLIVNNSGAIVRYRSIVIPFILIGFCLAGKENKQVFNNSN